MESSRHRHLKSLALLWLKNKVTDLVASEVKLTIRRKKMRADAAGLNLSRKEIRFIEVKTSKKDLMRDRALWGTSTSYAALGHYAYILAPKGILTRSDLPEGYGLLEAGEDDSITVAKNPIKNPDPILRFETVLKRAARASTNTLLFREANLEKKDCTRGAYEGGCVAFLQASTCPTCCHRTTYVTSSDANEVQCKHCSSGFTLAKGRSYVISRYNETFYNELSSIFKGEPLRFPNG